MTQWSIVCGAKESICRRSRLRIGVFDIEQQLGQALPETYRNLVLRYSFPPIEIGPVVLFSNFGDRSDDDITSATFKDPILSSWIIEAGYFHFGRTSRGNYDPSCLKLSATPYPKLTTLVVKFDHEAILCESSTVGCETISESFLDMLEQNA